MIFLFTKNQKIGSQLIRWGLEDEVSHFALVDSKHLTSSSLVLESTVSTGVRIIGMKEFLKHNEIVYAFTIPEASEGEHLRAFSTAHTQLHGKKYDIKGVSFLLLSVIICIKLLGNDLPPENKWADKSDFYCSETLEATAVFLWKYTSINLDRYSKQMLTPGRALALFKSATGVCRIMPREGAWLLSA